MSRGTAAKGALVRLGRRTSEANLARLRSALGYLEIGAFAQARLAGEALPMAPDRFAVFTKAAHLVTGDAPLYLEFGVYRGETMRWWAQHLRQPKARFVGFDSFEGLPAAWRPGFARGQFSTDGPPEIDDDRVEFVAGWFEDTLATYVPPDHDQLVVNVDCDLYSSAHTVLTWAAPYLTPGSLLYFDELADRDHELRALNELLADTDLHLRPLAAGGGGTHLVLAVL